MVSSWKRIAIAAIVSAIGCSATYWWHLKYEPKSTKDSDADVVAYVAKTKFETHRKGAKNTLWEPAEELDRLRAGDSVRTSGNSELRIQFANSNRSIDLEADSMIVIQKEASDINLELLEGSLFVNGVDQASNNTLSLKTQGGKIDLSKSTTQLNGSSSSKVDVKVLKGAALYMKNGKSESIDAGKEGGIGASGLRVTNEKIKILSPDLSKPTYLNASSPEPILIQWTGFPADSQVLLESGPSRKLLASTKTEKLSATQIQINWKPGTYYWRLKSMDPDTQKPMGESPIYKTEVIGRFPPTPVSPVPNFVIQTRGRTENITLRWDSRPDFKEVLVELENEATKQKLVNNRFAATEQSKEVPNLPLGTYNWRLTAFPLDGGKPLSSAPYRFTIAEKSIIKIPITWNPNLQPIQYFVSGDPKLTLMWEPDQSDRVRKWKVRVTPEGTDIKKAETTDTRQIKFETQLAKTGRYLASIEAFDDEGDNIGTSEVRTFNVEVLPLLGAPRMLPADGSEFLARPDGSMNLRWDQLNGANNYQILVRDNDGKIVVESSSETANYRLANLMPGRYSLQIGATDSFGRRGELSGKRTLLVPDKSEVKAPKLRKIKVD